MTTEAYRRSVERFNRRNRLVTKWARPKPLCATPYFERVALEILMAPLASFLAGNFPRSRRRRRPFSAP